MRTKAEHYAGVEAVALTLVQLSRPETTGEVTQGITGIAAPIFGERDKVLGSLSISFAARSMNAKRIVSIAERVAACAESITKAISEPAGTAPGNGRSRKMLV